MTQIILKIHETDECPDAEEIFGQLKEYNISVLGPANRKGLTTTARMKSGELIGGLIGYTHWDWLFINVLWVKEGFRGQNIGTSLITQSEGLAARRGCKAVHLDTFDFQAPGFYEKLGYLRFGEIQDCPVKGKNRLFYKKVFAV
jgi:ribosomal protein S18 acetylase RimI-like enzyme